MIDILLLNNLDTTHRYTLDATGVKFKAKEFFSRRKAESEMYKFLHRHNIAIKEVYNDKHYKTYVCENGIRFYINRI